MVSIHLNFLRLSFRIPSQVASPEEPPRPIFRAPAGPSAGDPKGRLFPHIALIPYPVPARDRIGLIKARQGVSALLPYWAEMGPGNSHYYYR